MGEEEDVKQELQLMEFQKGHKHLLIFLSNTTLSHSRLGLSYLGWARWLF